MQPNGSCSKTNTMHVPILALEIRCSNFPTEFPYNTPLVIVPKKNNPMPFWNFGKSKQLMLLLEIHYSFKNTSKSVPGSSVSMCTYLVGGQRAWETEPSAARVRRLMLLVVTVSIMIVYWLDGRNTLSFIRGKTHEEISTHLSSWSCKLKSAKPLRQNNLLVTRDCNGACHDGCTTAENWIHISGTNLKTGLANDELMTEKTAEFGWIQIRFVPQKQFSYFSWPVSLSAHV